MLRVWRISGEELAAINAQEVSDVRDLKKILRKLHGFPMCIQKLLHDGKALDSSTKLENPIDMQLVLLSLSSLAQQEEAANELTAYACEHGHVESGLLLENFLSALPPRS